MILASALADLILMSAMPTSAVIAIADARETTVLRLDRHRVQPDPALFGDLKVRCSARRAWPLIENAARDAPLRRYNVTS